MRRLLFFIILITSLTLVLGIFLYTSTPEISPYTVMLPLLLLFGVLFAVPAGFFLSFRRYFLVILISLGIVVSVPVLGGGQLDALACNTHGRTAIDELDSLTSGAQITFCGKLVLCEVASLTGDTSQQEVCVIRDVRDSDVSVVFFNYILPDQIRTTFEAGAEAELSLRDDATGTIIVREGRYEPDLSASCAVPGVCALQPLPVGEIYGNPVIFDEIRR